MDHHPPGGEPHVHAAGPHLDRRGAPDRGRLGRRSERGRDRRRSPRDHLRGCGGPTRRGRQRPGERGHALPDHVDDEDGRDRRRAAADGAWRPRSRRADRDLPARVGRDAGARRLRRRYAAPARARIQGHGQAPGHAHLRARLLVLLRRHPALGGAHRHAERARGRGTGPDGAAAGRPRHAVRVRHQHRLAGQGRRGRERQHAGCLCRRAHHRPARHDRDRLPDGRGQCANCTPVHLKGEDGAWELYRHRPASGPRLLGGRPRPALHPARLPEVPAHAARGRDLAGRRQILQQETVDAAFSTRSATSTSRRRSPPPTRPRRTTSTPAPATSGATGCCSTRRTSRACGAPYSGAWAGLLNTHFWVDTARRASPARSTRSPCPFVTPGAFGMYQDFERALYAAI